MSQKTRWKWGEVTLSRLPGRQEEESLKEAASDLDQVSGPREEEREQTPFCHEEIESTPASIPRASVEETLLAALPPEEGDDPIPEDGDHWIDITQKPPKKSLVSETEAKPRSITIWQVQATYVEGDYPQQWYLPIPTGTFPYPSGSFLIYNGDYFLLDRQMSMNTLKVFALSRACTRDEDPLHFLASFVPLTVKCQKRRERDKVRILANTPIAPLKEVNQAAWRAFDKIEPSYLYQVEARALPEDLSAWLPDDTRLCYVKFDERAWDTGFFAKVSAFPDKVHQSHRIELFPHDALLVAHLIADRIAPTHDIRFLPMYLLPEEIRYRVTSGLSFLLPTIGSPQRGRGMPKINTGESTIASRIGDLTLEMISRIKEWAMSRGAELFDFAAIKVSDLSNEGGERKVEVSVFADRLLGKQSGPVYECWLSPCVLDKALPWTPTFESQESFVRRVQVTAYALAHGGRRAAPEEIREAMPRATRVALSEASQDEEQPAFHVSLPLVLPLAEIEKLKEEAEQCKEYYSSHKKRKRAQAALLDLARKSLAQQLDARDYRHYSRKKLRTLRAYVEQVSAWFEQEKKPPQFLALAPAMHFERVERKVQVRRWDNPKSRGREQTRRERISCEWRTRTEERLLPVEEFELVLGIPSTANLPGTLDLDLVCQRARTLSKQEFLPIERPKRAPRPKPGRARRGYTVTRRRATEAELAMLAAK